MNNYNVEEFVNNLPEPRYTENIDMVCDSGAFNGSYLLGVLFYLKELERKNFIKINSVSGASIGSLMGCMYILNKLNKIPPLIVELVSNYTESHCFNSFSSMLDTFFSSLHKDEYKKLNNRMFITYFDIDNMREVVVSKYNSNNDLKEAILKSSFLPFFMNGNPTYKGAIDGMNPYIFNRRTFDDDKILFIRLTQYGMFKKMIFSRGEKNGTQRISEGVLDAHSFYTTNKKTLLCSWINHWSYLDYFKFRLRQFIRIIVVCCIFIYVNIRPLIPKKIFNNKYIRLIRFFLYQLFDDLFIIFYNS